MRKEALAASALGRSGANLEQGKMRVFATNVPRTGLHISRKVGFCPGSRRRWVLGSLHAFSQAVHAANTYRPRFQVSTRPSSPFMPRETLNRIRNHSSWKGSKGLRLVVFISSKCRKRLLG